MSNLNESLLYNEPSSSDPTYNPYAASAPAAPASASDQAVHDAVDHGEKFTSKGAKDLIWAALFLIHLVVVPVIGFIYFAKFRSDMSQSSSSSSSSDAIFTFKYQQEIYSNTTDIKIDSQVFGLLGATLGIASVVAFVMLFITKAFAKFLIYLSFGFFILSVTVSGLVAMTQSFLIGGILVGIAVLIGVWVYVIRHRIAFTSLMIKHAVSPIQKWPSTLGLPFFGVVLNFIWIVLWVISVISIYFGASRTTKCYNPYTAIYSPVPSDGICPYPSMKVETNEGGLVPVFLLLLSYYWTLQVIKNIVHTSTAGVTASYYFLFPTYPINSPTWNSFKRATTTSFGSICLGSLIVAAVRALRAVMSSVLGSSGQSRLGAIFGSLFSCVLSAVDTIVSYANQYAFSQVAIYGKSYCEAAKASWELFKARGFDAILNDSLVGMALTCACLIGGIISAVVSSLLAVSMDFGDGAFFIGLFGLIFGYAIVALVMEVVDSSVIAFFVCLCEDPAALQQTKPEVYDEVMSAISTGFPTINMHNV